MPDLSAEIMPDGPGYEWYRELADETGPHEPEEEPGGHV